MPVTITPITASDIPSAAHCIQTSFAQDPYYLWAFNPHLFNRDRNLASLRAKCEWGLRNALFYVAKTSDDDAVTDLNSPSTTTPDKVIGVSMWMKPHPRSIPQTWPEYLDDWILYLKQSLNLLYYRGRGGLRTNRYFIWKARQAEAQSQLWTDEKGYYFCNIVTVLPGFQGRGVGRKLTDVVLERADREGRRCYLESSRLEPNVRIYERLGFEVRRRMVCRDEADGEDEGCELFCMVREPREVKRGEGRIEV